MWMRFSLCVGVWVCVRVYVCECLFACTSKKQQLTTTAIILNKDKDNNICVVIVCIKCEFYHLH